MDGIIRMLYILGSIPIVTLDCPALETCRAELNRGVGQQETGRESMCGYFKVYRNCLDSAQLSCHLDLSNLQDEIDDEFSLCRTKRSGACLQKKSCDDQFLQTTSPDRCQDARKYENCLFQVMTSCDLTSRDLQPAINAVIQHCPGKRSILVAVNGVNSLGVFLKALLNDKDGFVCAGPNQCLRESTALNLASQRKTYAELCSSLTTTQNCLDHAVSKCTSHHPFSEALLDVARSEIGTLCKTHTGCTRLAQCSSLMLGDRRGVADSCSLVKQVLACLQNIGTICPYIPQIAIYRLRSITSQCDADGYTKTDVTMTTTLATTTTESLGAHVNMALVNLFRKLMSLIQIDSVSTRCVNMTSCVPPDYDYIDDLVMSNYDRFCDTMRKMQFCLSVVSSFCEGVSNELHQTITRSNKHLFETCRHLGLAVAASADTSARYTGLWLAVPIIVRTIHYHV